MNLAATFIEFAWIAHAARHRWREAGDALLAEFFEGKRDAYLSAAKLCRSQAREAGDKRL